MRPKSQARSGTIRYIRIAYWKWRKILGICPYHESPCRTEGRTGPTLNGAIC